MKDHKKLYEEELVKEIMISTALCVQELIKDDDKISEEGICQFLEEHYQSIIEETLNSEMEDGDEERWGSDEDR